MLSGKLFFTALLGLAAAKPAQRPKARYAGSSPWDAFTTFKRAADISSGCGTDGQLSCHNTTVQTDTCCFETPGGLILQTQFWDTDPSDGPTNSWTIHGLWPDNCDGTYEEDCDASRDYTDISSLLSEQGATDTLDFMETYWVNDPDDGSNEELWEHEWATHGTCYSTLQVDCLPSDSPTGAEAVAFFETVVKLFKTLPTYDWLAAADIVPSSSKKYSLSKVMDALKEGSGYTPGVTCSDGKLSGIGWYFNLRGSVIDGDFVPIDSPYTTCTSESVSYPTKTGTAVPTTTTVDTGTTTSTAATTTTTSKTKTSGTTTTSTSASATGTSASLPSKAEITASDGVGGLLSYGTWSVLTLATYHFSGTASSFTMSTSRSTCGINDNKLDCDDGYEDNFSAVTDDNGNLLLAYNGETTWSSDYYPSGEEQETVYIGSDHEWTYNLIIG